MLWRKRQKRALARARRAASTRGSSLPTRSSSSSRCSLAASRSAPLGAPDQGDEPVEALGHLPGEQLEVGGHQCGRDVVRSRSCRPGRRRGRCPAVRLSSVTLASPCRGLGVVGPGRQDLAVRRLGRLEVVAGQRVVGGEQLGVLRSGSLSCLGPGAPGPHPAERDHLVEEVAHLGLGERPGEAGDHLPLPHDQDRRDALHLRGRRQLRVRVDVDLGQHPGTGVRCGEALEDRRQLLARAAPLGPEVDDDRDRSSSARAPRPGRSRR